MFELTRDPHSVIEIFSHFYFHRSLMYVVAFSQSAQFLLLFSRET
jgi:hypothetical protein